VVVVCTLLQILVKWLDEKNGKQNTLYFEGGEPDGNDAYKQHFFISKLRLKIFEHKLNATYG